MAESSKEVKVNRSALCSCRTPQMKNNSCVFFGVVVVIAWLQSRDSDDAQNPDGGQEARGSYGKGRGKSVLQLQRHDYKMKMETENQ